MKKIVFTGGGTGGHIFPIIAVAREIKKINPYLEIFFIGPQDEISDQIFEEEGIKVKKIQSGKIRSYFNPASFLQNIIDIVFRVPLGIIQSFFYLFFLSPDLVFSKGGHGAFPVIIASRILQTPLFVHESDIVPGKVNQKSFDYALEIFTSFSGTMFCPPQKMILTGNPLKLSLLENIKPLFIKEKIGVNKDKPVILVIGGSQGSERINDLILSALPHLLPNYIIIHQSGAKNFKKIATQTDFLVKKDQKKNYHLFSFFNEEQLKYAYTACDFVVSRSGSGSIFEIAAFNKPSILIPLPESAQDHQTKNAYAYADTGAALVIEEENMTDHFFVQRILSLFNDENLLKEMSQKAAEFSRPKSAQVIAGYVVEFLK